MSEHDDATVQTMTDERTRDLVALHQELAREMEDLKRRAAEIVRKTQIVLDQAEMKHVLQHIVDNT